nr:immunoglobulin heavy chain junction region [Mus musculus]
CARANFYFDYW